MESYQRQINKIKKAVEALYQEGYRIEAELVETMLGTEKTHIYLRDKTKKGTVILQKHLFTLS